MKRTEWLQETRKMRFEEAYEGCKSGRFTHEKKPCCLVYVTAHFGIMWANITKVVWMRCWMSGSPKLRIVVRRWI